MARLPGIKARDVLGALRRAGFIQVRSSGSHRLLVHRDDPARIVVVPFHGAKDLKRGTLGKIIRQAKLSPAEFLEFL
jgi:predicted RNA binding protein YcfA (HicA-like mRNA interferase family)